MKNQGVLITAASGRIGRIIALHLARAGYYIYIHYRSDEQGAQQSLEHVRALGADGQCLHADLQDSAQVKALIDQCQHPDHPLLHVINNASQFSEDDLLTFKEEDLMAHMAVNLQAPMILARELYQRISEPQKGSVINIVDSKVFALNPDYYTYSLSKVALQGATEMMAQRLAPKVRVNGIAPGLTLISHKQSDLNFELASHLNFNGEPIDAQDIANTCLMLMETRSINGVTIAVDGGQKMMNLSGDIVHIAQDILDKGLT